MSMLEPWEFMTPEPEIKRNTNPELESLRDYFAGQVLSGLLTERYYVSNRDAAKKAYKIADAMLEERSRV